MKNIVREPQQERSIEKKNKIIQAGYELFTEVGYYGTNTVEIAKRAGVSTGIVYGYFTDKRDILICVLKIYIENVSAPLIEIMQSMQGNFEIVNLTHKILDKKFELHEQYAKLHNTLHSLAAADEAVNAEFIKLENDITIQMSEQLKGLGVKVDNITEKVHLAMNIIQSFAHEYVFDNHAYIDYSQMKEIVCKIIIALFSQ